MPTLSPIASGVDELTWDEFLHSFRWQQGQHLVAIGPTESGKTTLIRELLEKAYQDGTHPWQSIAATKTLDEVLDTFSPLGFVTLPEWIVADPDITPRVIIHPRLRSLAQEDRAVQSQVLADMANAVYRQHGWLVYYDEFKHVITGLGLKNEAEMLLHQGRSAGITVVMALQRPRHVPLMAYDQSEHMFFWESRDHNIRDRLSEIGGKADPELVAYAVSKLRKHDFLYVSPVTGEIKHSEVEI
jgi:hypothetical protein